MKVKLNKRLIIEGEHFDEFMKGVNEAASHGTPGAPTLTDGVNKVMSDMAKERAHATSLTQAQIRYINTNNDDAIRNEMLSKHHGF